MVDGKIFEYCHSHAVPNACAGLCVCVSVSVYLFVPMSLCVVSVPVSGAQGLPHLHAPASAPAPAHAPRTTAAQNAPTEPARRTKRTQNTRRTPDRIIQLPPTLFAKQCLACTCMQSGQVDIQRLPSTLSRLIAKQKLDSVATAEEPVTAKFYNAFPTMLVVTLTNLCARRPRF